MQPKFLLGAQNEHHRSISEKYFALVFVCIAATVTVLGNLPELPNYKFLLTYYVNKLKEPDVNNVFQYFKTF